MKRPLPYIQSRNLQVRLPKTPMNSAILHTSGLTTLLKQLPLPLQNTRYVRNGTLIERGPLIWIPGLTEIDIPIDVRFEDIISLLSGRERGPIAVEGASAMLGGYDDTDVDLVEDPGEGAGEQVAGLGC